MEKVLSDDPRSRRTRRLLQSALTELMTKKKFNEISVQDITAKAEVNRATFYAHFDDKYQLLNAHIRDSFKSLLRERLPERPMFTLSNLRILSLTAHQYLSTFGGHCASAAFKTDEALMVQQVHREMLDTIRDWMHNTPTLATDANIDFTATVVSWALFGAIIEKALDNRKMTSEQVADQVLVLLEPSLRDYLVAEAAY